MTDEALHVQAKATLRGMMGVMQDVLGSLESISVEREKVEELERMMREFGDLTSTLKTQLESLQQNPEPVTENDEEYMELLRTRDALKEVKKTRGWKGGCGWDTHKHTALDQHTHTLLHVCIILT